MFSNVVDDDELKPKVVKNLISGNRRKQEKNLKFEIDCDMRIE